MSKEKNTEQMSLLEGSRANHSPLREKDEEQRMIASSGMKLLELYPSKNPNGSLAKMLKALLTSKTAWCSDRSTMTWKAKVSKCKVLLFQLAVSVRGIKEKGFGSLPTPTTMDHIDRKGMRPSRAATNRKSGYLSEIIKMYPTPRASGQENPETLIKRKGLKQAAQHNLTAAVQMYPTPTPACEEGGEQSSRVEQTKSGGFVLRKKNKPNMTFGAKLSDAMLFLEKEKMLPTPTNSEHKYRLKGNTQASNCLEAKARRAGGKLNPTFVEFLMGYPMNWTKIEQTELKVSETQSFHKSQEKSEKQSLRLKMYPTPRANEPGRTTKGYGRGLAELLEGKKQREPK